MNFPLKARPVRPALISVICILGFIFYGIVFIITLIALIGGSVFLGMAGGAVGAGVGIVMSIVAVLILLLYFLPLIGYWNMRRWGPILYLVLFLIGLVLALIGNSFALWTWSNWVGLVIDLIVIGVGFAYYKQMT